jgi:hypothetical protein
MKTLPYILRKSLLLVAVGLLLLCAGCRSPQAPEYDQYTQPAEGNAAIRVVPMRVDVELPGPDDTVWVFVHSVQGQQFVCWWTFADYGTQLDCEPLEE